MYKGKILADSISPDGARLTTFQITFPRFILPELNTHRAFSRNLSSSRAVSFSKMVEKVVQNPVIPNFEQNTKQMASTIPVDPVTQEQAEQLWLSIRDFAVEKSTLLAELGVHKQWVNRCIEPWLHAEAVVSATEWDNFFGLRCHPDAQPEIRNLAEMMLAGYVLSKPRLVRYDEYHLPFITQEDEDDFEMPDLIKIAIGRLARVSYYTKDGKRDPKADIQLYERLCLSYPLHSSPSEHVARPGLSNRFYGNFKGWIQYRKELRDENIDDLRKVISEETLDDIVNKWRHIWEE